MPGWRVTQTPKYARLRAVVTDGVAAFCVGQRGLLAERLGPDDWWARCLNGPDRDRCDLFDAALSARNERLWFCGAEGTVGSYSRVTGAVRPHEPSDTADFRHLAVRGRRGAESVFVADDCGRVLRLSASGEKLSVEGAAVPGDGTALTALISAGETLIAADLAGRLYWSDDGRRWRDRKLTSTAIAGLAHGDGSGLVAVDEAGRLYRHALPTGEGRLAVAELELPSPSAVAADGERIAVAGGKPHRDLENPGSGTLAVIGGERGVRAPKLDEPLYGAELLTDGTVLGVGNTGVVAEREID